VLSLQAQTCKLFAVFLPFESVLNVKSAANAGSKPASAQAAEDMHE
jgi:hypothetical protein